MEEDIIPARPRPQPQEVFWKQMARLRRHSIAFDKGEPEAALEIASALYVLAFDEGSQRSLISALGLNHTMTMRATKGEPPLKGKLHHWQCHLVLAGYAGKFVPAFETCDFENMGFSKWWNRPIFRAKSGATLSRKEFMKGFANQDGARHFDADPKRSAVYKELVYDNGMRLGMAPSNTQEGQSFKLMAIPGVEEAIMRQIAFEFDCSAVVNGLAMNPSPRTKQPGIAVSFEVEPVE
jgi:hypothetical protein